MSPQLGAGAASGIVVEAQFPAASQRKVALPVAGPTKSVMLTVLLAGVAGKFSLQVFTPIVQLASVAGQFAVEQLGAGAASGLVVETQAPTALQRKVALPVVGPAESETPKVEFAAIDVRLALQVFPEIVQLANVAGHGVAQLADAVSV